ncbi:hypothetical protein NPIL_167041 [Nephila pilipes]|uniref:Uncharacterized protein n=1 Tax=Nephila pilipes TaxID=299642 RepID=A0A8X6N853_NEPPI|nr:hypothetical protein NPIL_167041 [Nephila pilipes]
MNRILWKCCGKTFSDITKYNDHFLIVHTRNADYKGTDATNSSDHTTLRESADSGSKQIRITKNSTEMNESKKDISVVDSISITNDSEWQRNIDYHANNLESIVSRIDKRF